MQNTYLLNRIAWRVFAALGICLCISLPAEADVNKELKNAAKSLSKEIEQAQFHKVYVADFLDPSGTRTERGCFFASTFSTDLAKEAHNFEVVNRIEAQKQLNELHISAQDLLRPETLAKAAQALGADAILGGTATITAKDANLRLSLRETASAKEIYSMEYHERLDPAFESNFPAVEAESGHVYYFPGLDGISQPKCKYCPNPDYTDEARAARIEGKVVLSVSLDERGAITSVRVVTNPDDSMTRKAVDILKKWRMEPSRDPEGQPVPVQVNIEIVFRLLS